MLGRYGSWPALLALAVAFVLLFYWQRSRSTFLRIEQERPVARAFAARAMIPVADVLALRDMVGLDASVAAWQRLVTDYAKGLRHITGSSMSLRRPAVRNILPVGARAQVVEAWPPGPVATAAGRFANSKLAQRRFMLLRERFAARR